jgi:hypothetical protein
VSLIFSSVSDALGLGAGSALAAPAAGDPVMPEAPRPRRPGSRRSRGRARRRPRSGAPSRRSGNRATPRPGLGPRAPTCGTAVTSSTPSPPSTPGPARPSAGGSTVGQLEAEHNHRCPHRVHSWRTGRSRLTVGTPRGSAAAQEVLANGDAVGGRSAVVVADQ